MEVQFTYNWTRDDFTALARALNRGEGWGDYEFAQRSRNEFKILVPAGWKVPSQFESQTKQWERSNKALRDSLLVIGIFIVLPWIFKKVRHNRFRN